MMSQSIKIKNHALPDSPGVYLMKDATGTVLYVGRATSLNRRVRQHFERPHSRGIEEMTKRVAAIEYVEKTSVLEALILEANLIKYYWPKYNVSGKDQKSFLYLAITREDFPKPLLIRGQAMDESSPKKYKAVFGPYTSPRSLRAALDFIRKIFPWSTCEAGKKRPCFFAHLKLCPGVCVNAIEKKAYQKTIRGLIRFFEGKKESVLKAMRREMERAAREKRYEKAAALRDTIFSLEHIQDVAVLKREDDYADRIKTGEASVNLFGRVEGYDVSNISETSTVASMVVFENGASAKNEYRKFCIRSVHGVNDTAAMREALMRRFRHPWHKPDLILVDGGLPQVRAAESVIHHLTLGIPVIGIAKGQDRKRNDLVCSKRNKELCDLCEQYKAMLVRIRDEAHRFAITYHRKLRGKFF